MPLAQLSAAMSKVAWGRQAVVERVLVVLLAEGHLLIDDVPGVGKTTLVRGLAQSLDLTHRRLQFTPDLLPSDVTGFTYYDGKTQSFLFRPGPVFCNLLLADEINRTSPKTQSSLLEAMEEHQVTVDGQVYPLARPFMVVATQNPIEYEGTFALPEAQLDRFLLRIRVGYPDGADERQAMQAEGDHQHPPRLEAVMSAEELAAAAEETSRVPVADQVVDYAQAVVQATRQHPALRLGVSPRGAIAWIRASRALAYLRQARFVTPDHLRDLAAEALAHRLLLRPEPIAQGLTAADVVAQVVNAVPLPGAARRLG
ncbi:MAG: AAA family ATPase [Sulfobacillus sp.]